MIYGIISFFVVLFESICEVLFFDTFMLRRTRLKPWILSVLIIVSLGTATLIIGVFFGDRLLIKSLFMFTSFFLVINIFYKASVAIKLTMAAMMLFLGFAADAIFVFSFMQIFSHSFNTIVSDPFYTSIMNLASKSILFIAIFSIRRFWRLGTIQKAEKGSNLAILLYPPVIAILTILTFILSGNDSQTDTQRLLVAISSIGLTFLSLVIFYLAQSITDRQRKIRENDLLKQKVEIEMGSVVALADSFQNQRRMMHDYSNQMGTIRQLLSGGHYSKAREYVAQIAETVEVTMHRIRTNNEIVDAVLNQKDITARKKGISFILAADDLSCLPMSGDDVVAILANILDNAIEACEHVDEHQRKTIQVKLEYRRKQFLFSVVNPVTKQVPIKDGTIETTKSDKSVHGLGLHNVASALEKYGASYELFCDGNSFQFTTVADLQKVDRTPA